MTRTKWGQYLYSPSERWPDVSEPPPEFPREEEEGDDESMSPADWENCRNTLDDFNHYYDWYP